MADLSSPPSAENRRGRHIVIVTDVWKPAMDGVINTLDHVSGKLREFGHKVTLIAPESERYHTIRLPGYPRHRIAYWPKSGKDWVRARLEELQPDHIHIATPEGPLGRKAVEICRRRHLNFTTSFHTKTPEYAQALGIPGAAKWGYELLKYFHRGAHCTMVPTASIFEELAGRGFKNLRQWTRGVNTEIFHPGPTQAYDGLPRPIFLNVGRVSSAKNLEAFLDLDLPGTKVVVGAGGMLEDFRKRYPDVKFVGEKKGRELAEYYRGADVFVFPSRTDTFGLVQLEALASGVPVAAYPVPGPKDVITSPEVGVLDEDLRAACMKALEMKKRGCEKDCRQYVLDRYTWDRAARIFEENLVEVGARNPWRDWVQSSREIWERRR